MLIPRGTLCTLIAGACAAESIEWSPPTAESNETRNPRPILLSARSPISQQDDQSNESSQDGGSLGNVESGVPMTEDDGLEARQVAALRAPTVFSTSYVTSTITTFVGEPVTSTIFETITATASIVPQKRTIPWNPSSKEIRSHLEDALWTPDDPPRGSDRKKRQNNLSTVTSVIYMISRTVVTVAPTISTTIPVTVTIATDSDGSTTTLQPSTTSQLPSTTTTSLSKSSSSKTSSQSSQTSLPTGTPATSTLNQGAIAGGVLGSVFGAALLIGLFLCCIRRRRRERKPAKDTHPRDAGYTTTLTSSSTLDRDEGTLIHHESFHVGASPPASLALSASEQKSQQQTLSTTPPPTIQMKQVLPAVNETSCEVQQRPDEMTQRQSSRAGMIWLVSEDNEEEENSSSGGSGFDSNEAQPPSPVASSDIFGPYNSTYRQARDTWASTADTSLSFATPRNLTMLGSDFDDRPQTSESMENAMWRDGDDDHHEQSGRDSWSPSIPEKSKRRSQSKDAVGKAVRFQETPTTPTRKSSGSGGKSVDGSSAFL